MMTVRDAVTTSHSRLWQRVRNSWGINLKFSFSGRENSITICAAKRNQVCDCRVMNALAEIPDLSIASGCPNAGLRSLFMIGIAMRGGGFRNDGFEQRPAQP